MKLEQLLESQILVEASTKDVLSTVNRIITKLHDLMEHTEHAVVRDFIRQEKVLYRALFERMKFVVADLRDYEPTIPNSWINMYIDSVIYTVKYRLVNATYKTIAQLYHNMFDEGTDIGKILNVRKYSKDVEQSFFTGVSYASNDFAHGVFILITHYIGISVHVPNLTNINPGDYTRFSDFVAALRQMEYDWKNSPKSKEVDEYGELILDLGDYRWYNLNQSYCGKEATAMRHCGNKSGHSSDKILSLRKVVDNNKLIPVLTFILHSSGYLGEMKGRGNSKPKEEYHPYIVELLKLPIIKGLRGGGYMPDNNFHPNDLSDEHKDELLKARDKSFLNMVYGGEK